MPNILIGTYAGIICQAHPDYQKGVIGHFPLQLLPFYVRVCVCVCVLGCVFVAAVVGIPRAPCDHCELCFPNSNYQQWQNR